MAEGIFKPKRCATTIEDAWSAPRARGNNFDAVRLFAAGLVLYGHSFLVADGRNNDIFFRLTGEQSELSNLGLAIFFVLSGFLVTKSWARAPEIGVFARNRFLRVYPGLAAVILTSVFVVGPLMTRLPLADYFSSPETWAYLSHFGFLYHHGDLPGVFDAAAFEPTVNKPLWTLQVETLCYLSLPLIAAAKGFSARGCILVQIVCMGLAVIVGGTIDSPFEAFLRQLAIMFSWFYGGALLALAGRRIPLDARLAFLCVIILAVSAHFGGFAQAFAFAGAYLVLYVGFLPSRIFSKTGRFGDFSYGIYIWAWPVQQIVAERAAPGDGLAVLALSAPIALLLAWGSWTLIEKPALALKKKSPRPATETAPAH